MKRKIKLDSCSKVSTTKGFMKLSERTTVPPDEIPRFISWIKSQKFPLTNPCHSFLSSTILFAFLTFKALFFFSKKSFYESIHLFPTQPTFSNLTILYTSNQKALSSIFSLTPFFNLYDFNPCIQYSLFLLMLNKAL